MDNKKILMIASSGLIGICGVMTIFRGNYPTSYYVSIFFAMVIVVLVGYFIYKKIKNGV